MVTCEQWAAEQDELDRWSRAVDIMAQYYRSIGVRKGAARRIARNAMVDDEDRGKIGRLRGLAAASQTRRDRAQRLDRRGRCWMKISFGDVYCGRHGRLAGWPCQARKI